MAAASVDISRVARCTQVPVPRKVRELIQDLRRAGFSEYECAAEGLIGHSRIQTTLER